MTTFLNSIENVPNGATPTTGNSAGGSDTGLGNISIGAGGAIVSDTTQAAHGTQSLSVTAASGTASYVGWSPTASGSAATRIYVYFTAAPTAAMSFMQLRSASGIVGNVAFNATGKLILQNAAGTTIWTATAAFPLNTWIRIGLGAVVGTTSSNGTLNCAYYTLDSLTATDSFTGTANQNSGTANVNEARYGKLTGTYTTQWWMDDLALTTGSSAFVGPAGATVPNAPTGVTATAGILSANVSWTAPAFNGGSAITGYTVTSSPGGLTSTVGGSTLSTTVSGLTAGTAYTFTVVAINAIPPTSAPSSPSSAVTPTAPGQAIAPASDITTTGWTSSDSAGVFATDIDEATPGSDTDYVSSPSNPSSSVFEVKFGGVATPADNNGWAVQVRARYRSASSNSLVIALVQGTTVIASTTVTLTASFATYTLTLTPTQGATISNLSDLRVRCTATAS